MNNAPAVSVVIPTYNRARFLKRAVASVLAQSFQDFEIIIVDDGSTDGTDQVLQAILTPRIEVVRLASNGGASIARNEGIKRSRGEFVAFLDSDDEWSSTKLQKQVDLIRKSQDVGVVNCGVIVKEKGGIESRRWIRELKGTVPLTLLGIGRDPASMWLIRRSCLERFDGPFDEEMMYGQVSELIFRVGKITKFSTVPEHLVIYHNHQSEPRNANYDMKKKIKSLEIYFEKHKAEIMHDPELHVFFLNYIALRYIEADQGSDARANIFSSLRVKPFYLNTWLFFLLTLLGPWSVNVGRSIKRHLRASLT